MKTFWLALALLLLALHLGADATTINVSVNKSDEAERIGRIAWTVGRIVSSPEFKARVISSTFEDTKDSSQKIYETLTPSEWILVYELKKHPSLKVLGWTYPSTKTVWFNSRNFHGREDKGIAGTICHEQAHKLGYGHRSAKSHRSVPYSVGTICAELYLKFK